MQDDKRIDPERIIEHVGFGEISLKKRHKRYVTVMADRPNDACLGPDTVRWLDEVARRAEAGDVEFLRNAGRVFQSVYS